MGTQYNFGRITTGGTITEFPLTSLIAGAMDIVAGPDGNLWFTEPAGRIGRITTDGTIVEYTVGVLTSTRPWGITVGPDNALWFIDSKGTALGRITTEGDVSQYPISVPSHTSYGYLVAAPDGNLWFTNWDNHIYRFSMQ